MSNRIQTHKKVQIPNRFLQQRRSRRGGSIITVVALALVALCACAALAVDYGILVSDANRMQRASDAGALAGVVELKKTTSAAYDEQQAKAAAVRVAQQNGAPNATINDVTISDNGTRITLASRVSRSFFFAKFFGQQSKTISRQASATVEAAGEGQSGGSGPGHVVPVGITLDTYNAYKDDYQQGLAKAAGLPVFRTITLVRQNKEIFGKDDFALFDLRDNNAKSPAQFEDQLTGADVEKVYLNDGSSCDAKPLTCETTLNAAQPATSKKLEDGMETLFNRSQSAPWYDNGAVGLKARDAQNGIGLDNPRVMSMLVTNSTTVPNNGTFDTPVLGFAPVYVQSVSSYSLGKETVYTLTVAFLGPTQAAESVPGIPNNSNANLTGVRVMSLSD